ncbi:MAG: nitrous oxide-stimulated promoter family protein [Woeseiaceae bacterium]|nr:nitrous oxide-stimulated promoter family protein [Woeseiaceae bacterium]
MRRRFSARHLERERVTMEKMVDIYCADHHEGSAGDLCPECSAFLEYAEVRLDKCPYGEDKPTCSNCPVHCYKAPQREYARRVMRYAGPRMLLRHPILAIAHMIDGRRQVKHPGEKTRDQRLQSRRESEGRDS